MTHFPFLPLLCLAASVLAQGCRTASLEYCPAAEVPRVIFPALCAAFITEEEFESSTTTIVLGATRPLYRTFALRTLHEAGEMTPAEADQDDARDDALVALFQPSRVEEPAASTGCRWLLSNRSVKEHFGRDELMLELSSIVEDPFAAAAGFRFGVFARLSIGGASGASWYWVALQRIGDSWEVSSVTKLEISDG